MQLGYYLSPSDSTARGNDVGRFIVQTQHSVKPRIILLLEIAVVAVSVGYAALLWLGR